MGQNAPPHSTIEQELLHLIEHGTMDTADAQHFIDNLDMSSPWKRREDFMRALAAISAIFKGDMNRRLHRKNRRVRLRVALEEGRGVRFRGGSG